MSELNIVNSSLPFPFQPYGLNQPIQLELTDNSDSDAVLLCCFWGPRYKFYGKSIELELSIADINGVAGNKVAKCRQPLAGGCCISCNGSSPRRFVSVRCYGGCCALLGIVGTVVGIELLIVYCGIEKCCRSVINYQAFFN